jgi:hypothetical protein
MSTFGVHNPIKDWKQGDFPAPAGVILVLNEPLGLIDGFPALSASLASDSEIDFEVARLQEQIRLAGAQAKRTLAAQIAKIRPQSEA